MNTYFRFICILLCVCFRLSAQENPHKNLQSPCSTCHTTAGWDSVSFDHTQTKFELNGTHKKLDCADCHEIEDFSKAKRKCISCHLDYHEGRLTPECESCHTDRSWALFDPVKAHQNTSFKLLGKHANLDCGTCHFRDTQGGFLRLESDCFKCHLTDYKNAVNPVHTDLGFGIRCEDCHSFFSWRPALFKGHDSSFPIFSGTHSGEWDDCTDCHTQQNNYTIFSCFKCHHKSSTDAKHDEERGYVYDSQACLNCHPNGGE